MSVSINRIIQYLQDFGLNKEEANVYLHLFKHGMMSVLDMSKELKISRPKLYRILDRLEDLDLVVKEHGKGSRFAPASYKHLEFLLARREEELSRLKKVKDSLFDNLDQLARRYGDVSKVREHHGFKGLKHVYKQTFGHNEVVLLDSGEFLIHKDEAFWKILQKGWLRDKTRVSLLSNLKQREKSWFSTAFLKKCWSAWWIDPSDYLISAETLIYSDTVVICQENRSGINCVEFKNRLLAQSMKRLYEFVWIKAEEQEY